MAELGEANIGGRMVPAWLLNGNANGLDISESSEHPGCFYRKLSGGSVEWFNPPMLINTEYRTTERYLGKPVYVKAVDFESLPNTTRKEKPHGVSNIDKVISVIGQESNGMPLPRVNVAYLWANLENVYVETQADVSVNTATLIIKCTKTTD